MTVKAKPLTPDAFKPYGQVLMGPGQGPERYEFAAAVDNRRGTNAKANFTFMRSKLAQAPVTVRAMERHVFSNQIFVPMNGTAYLVAACPSTAAGDPDLDRLEVFVATGGQAINLDTGVWHAPNTPLGAPGEFVMLRFDDGSPADTELRSLDTPIEVDVSACQPVLGHAGGRTDSY
jgi:ureidoglycolate hydrolase